MNEQINNNENHRRDRNVVVPTSTGDVCCGVYGDDSCKRVVFFFHGFPGSRIEAWAFHEVAKNSGVTIIAPDRPGIGQSSYVPGRRIIDWAKTVGEIADHFSVKSFTLLAISGGTPYGFACARFLQDRVDKYVVVSGVCPFQEDGVTRNMAPLHKTLLAILGVSPVFMPPILGIMGTLLRTSRLAVHLFLGCAMNEKDKEIIRERHSKKIFRMDLQEALRQGVRGLIHEFKLLTAPWGFERSDVTVPTVLIHGTVDLFVPIEMMEANARALQNLEIIKIPDEGHLVAFKIAPLLLQKCLD